MSQTSSTTPKAPGFLARFLAQMRENRRNALARRHAAGATKASSAVQPAAPIPSAHRMAPNPPGGTAGETPVAAELKRYAYVRWLIRLLAASVALNGVVLFVLFLTGLLAGQRPQMQLTARPSLRAEAEAMFGSDTEVNVDDLLLYLNTVLPIMHRLDDRGAPDLPLLRGLIAPAEYEKALSESSRSSLLAKKNLVVQNLVVTRVEEVVSDNERGRVSAYVRGYLAIIIQSSSKQVIMPYRAEVLMEMAPPSRLNRFPFVLIRREWRIGNAATSWDELRAKSKPSVSAIPASDHASK